MQKIRKKRLEPLLQKFINEKARTIMTGYLTQDEIDFVHSFYPNLIVHVEDEDNSRRKIGYKCIVTKKEPQKASRKKKKNPK